MIEKMNNDMVEQPIELETNSDSKPNGVLFKTDLGTLTICLIKDKEFDWENILVLDMDKMTDKYDDILSDPFEFVFIYFNEDSFKTTDTKTTVYNNTFTKLYDEGLLEKVIKSDYEKQYGKL
jgi:hypothetical protein